MVCGGHYVHHSSDSCVRELSDVSFMTWERPNKDISFSNLLKMELVYKVSISFVTESVDNIDSINILPKICFVESELTLIPACIFYLECSPGVPLPNGLSFELVLETKLVVKHACLRPLNEFTINTLLNIG